MAVDFFERDLKLATADLEPDAINAMLAKFAKESVREVISSGRASENYERYVNGRLGVAEEAVQAPGPIIYEFSLWEPIITFALDELRRRSPVKSGRFRSSFIVLANQREVRDYDAIGPGDEVIITNFQPYVRKAENGLLGAKRYSIFDGTKRALASRFGNEGRNAAAFVFETQWLNVQAGVHAGMPYILKRHQGRRKDRQAGMAITYPAVVINQV
ncbi:hypothetical protein [Rhizobium chutanense]|nr:hypothetical protein [Rhizobium chutanense]